MRIRFFLWLPACAIVLLLHACSSSRVINSAAVNISGNYCEPAVRYSSNADSAPLKNTDSLLAANADLPAHVVLMANATGTLLLVKQMKAVTGDTTALGFMKKAEIRSRIQHRLLLATMEIAGIAAELDCEGEKADQLARYLDNFNSKRNTRLTVASIITGALTTIATVAIKKDGPQNVVAIGGGLLSAGLGALTINAAGRKIQFLHPRNTLQDIWEMPEISQIYPPFTWYVLTEKHFSNSGKIPLAASIRERWQKFDFEGKISSSDSTLFFGTGGVYKADDLHTRAAMLNELQSTIRSVNQDLERLLHYLVSIE
ncbi:hypothetical protein [Chitinophaga arvensicola]|uniref:Uncharacterized protein n=1 Tax=Chitinophaga arvensicola TaxID=29529 RepID=A0A1I0SA87_9BACT|nr:hypothetical protein [Chitinophaga arvensicola]SEW53025.1 hypothetical protein SAMN04488122_5303 [Chitinophaga arvensicola]